MMLHDRCYQCQQPGTFHRVELRKANLLQAGNMNHCWNCNALLSEAQKLPIIKLHKLPFTQWETLLKVVDRQFKDSGPFNLPPHQ
ncbi:MAG: hypothetical protein HLUCCO02_08955 [Idiomarinaceae bacterium HL-53]|nr:MAG: hypothetical protein HLUCCO02_08955 [Idiomarinaceae bacterium HL-53]